MWPETRLTALLGIDLPIIQAPMAGATTPALAAAVANAGAMGSLGCAFLTPAAYTEQITATRAMTNRALNVNFFCHTPPRDDPGRNAVAAETLAPMFEERGLGAMPAIVETNVPYGPEIHKAVLASCPQVVSFHFGLPDPAMVDALKAEGAVILCSATTAAEARDLEARGTDAIIAQGWEAGGHHGFYLSDRPSQTGTMALVPQVVDAVSVPVIAAGGIADGRAIAAALALGAEGVQIGTAFLATEEAHVAAPHRAAIARSDGTDTRTTRAFSGRPARGIANHYMDAMEPHENALPDFPLMNTVTAPLRAASAKAGDQDYLSLWAGQAVGLARPGSATALIDRLDRETRAVIAGLAGAA